MNRLKFRSSAVSCLVAFASWLLPVLPGSAQSPAPAAPPKFTAYLMAYFGPEEKLFYAFSRDARDWTPLNAGRPVFDAGVRLRDPFLDRVDGTFYLVHTKGWDYPQIGHWTSTDLVHWSGGIVNVVPPEAKCAWAPEFSYLAAEKKFYVYWSSMWHGHRVIFYTTTRDWSDLSPARSAVYYDLGINDIDLTVREHAGTYYAFHKPGTVDDMMGNRLLTSHSLDPQVESFAKEGDGPGKDVLPDQSQPTEAPETVQLIGQDRWYVYGDPFHHPMEAWETTDFATFKKIVVHPPPRAKHCSMIPITEEELARLQALAPAASTK